MNAVQSFLFDDLNIRGRYLRLSQEWIRWQDKRHYTPAAFELLGQCAAFMALIAADVKHAGKLSLQLRSDQSIKTLLIQCDIDEDNLKIRGMIDAPLFVHIETLPEALAQGDLALTLHNPITKSDYQSFVPIEGNRSSDIFSSYLSQSVQQPTQLWLIADQQQITGLLLEKMPDSDHKDQDGWNRITHLASTLTDQELAHWSLDELLHHLFHEEIISRYPMLPVVYHCPDERHRVMDMLKSLGQSDCEQLLAQEGNIIVSNDVCAKDYVFNAQDIQHLFDAQPEVQ